MGCQMASQKERERKTEPTGKSLIVCNSTAEDVFWTLCLIPLIPDPLGSGVNPSGRTGNWFASFRRAFRASIHHIYTHAGVQIITRSGSVVSLAVVCLNISDRAFRASPTVRAWTSASGEEIKYFVSRLCCKTASLHTQTVPQFSGVTSFYSQMKQRVQALTVTSYHLKLLVRKNQTRHENLRDTSLHEFWISCLNLFTLTAAVNLFENCLTDGLWRSSCRLRFTSVLYFYPKCKYSFQLLKHQNFEGSDRSVAVVEQQQHLVISTCYFKS